MSPLHIPDPFADILTTTNAHRAGHGCGAYPYDKGTLLGVLAAAVNAQHIVEVGTAFGYSALWLAHGARQARVDTIEFDPEHVRIARQHFADHKMADRIQVHQGDALTVLNSLDSNVYDLAFFDGFAPNPQLIEGLRRRLRTGGVLVCANLTLGSPDASRPLADPGAWMTHSLGETAIAVKR
jgi:predicted O-methyltransferase YrrM